MCVCACTHLRISIVRTFQCFSLLGRGGVGVEVHDVPSHPLHGSRKGALSAGANLVEHQCHQSALQRIGLIQFNDYIDINSI